MTPLLCITNVALTHKDMQEFFKEVSETAEALGVAHSKFPSDRAPVVVVGLNAHDQ